MYIDLFSNFWGRLREAFAADLRNPASLRLWRTIHAIWGTVVIVAFAVYYVTKVDSYTPGYILVVCYVSWLISVLQLGVAYWFHRRAKRFEEEPTLRIPRH